MSALSRRSIVASAAALPALAVPAVAMPAVAAGGSNADDRLVSLAKEVFEVWEELGEVCARTDAAQLLADDNDAVSVNNYAAAEAAQIAVSVRMHAAVDVMRQILPQSIRGLAAKARVADLLMRDDNGEPHSEGWENWMVVDDLLAMEPKEPNGLRRRGAVMSADDPVFAAIEQHRTAHRAVEDGPAEPPSDLTDALYEQSCRLGDTTPTSLAGVIAILRYRREVTAAAYDLFPGDGGAGHPRADMENWLAVIERALTRIAGQLTPAEPSG
jgi:hypothetical protein